MIDRLSLTLFFCTKWISYAWLLQIITVPCSRGNPDWTSLLRNQHPCGTLWQIMPNIRFLLSLCSTLMRCLVFLDFYSRSDTSWVYSRCHFTFGVFFHWPINFIEYLHLLVSINWLPAWTWLLLRKYCIRGRFVLIILGSGTSWADHWFKHLTLGWVVLIRI